MIKFAKKNSGAKIPSKTPDNAGYDLYACFDEPFVRLKPHKTTLIPTGLLSCFDKEYYVQFQNRGSNGSKGLLQACGVVDSSYRGEWFVALTNTNDCDWYIVKNEFIGTELFNSMCIKDTFYPYEKAICQFVVLPVPKIDIIEVTEEEIKNEKSERGAGNLGSSRK